MVGHWRALFEVHPPSGAAWFVLPARFPRNEERTAARLEPTLERAAEELGLELDARREFSTGTGVPVLAVLRVRRPSAG